MERVRWTGKGEIRVFLLESHAVVRHGLRALFTERMPAVTVVGESDSGEEALRLVPRLGPSIVLMELELSGMSVMHTLSALRETAPWIRSIAFSTVEDTERVRAFFDMGGSGYVPKRAPEIQLLDAVAAVARGEHYAPPRTLSELALGEDDATPSCQAKLTEREQETVRRVARGETYREIGAALNISGKTVATYRCRAADKLGLQSRAELVQWALRHDLVS